MKNKTLTLPGFHLATLRRKPRSAQQILAQTLDALRQKSVSQLGVCFGHLIPPTLLKPTPSGAMSRRRLFSKENTFWAFFSQVLDPDGGCQAVVRKLQSYAALSGHRLPSSATGAYCQARQKLELDELDTLLQLTSERLQPRPDPAFLKGRRVLVVDGTGLRACPIRRQTSKCGPSSVARSRAADSPRPRPARCFVWPPAG